jgi:hypothetical protein
MSEMPRPPWTFDNTLLKNEGQKVLMAHAHNPSYSEGRDQEDHGSKPAKGNGL